MLIVAITAIGLCIFTLQIYQFGYMLKAWLFNQCSHAFCLNCNQILKEHGTSLLTHFAISVISVRKNNACLIFPLKMMGCKIASEWTYTVYI